MKKVLFLSFFLFSSSYFFGEDTSFNCDPERNFMPSTGRLNAYIVPDDIENIRNDTGVYECVACNLCINTCPVDDCITMVQLLPGQIDERTGQVVAEEYGNWTEHPNNPSKVAAE